MRRRIVKTMVLLVLALAVPARALAALGADASSVARDREAFKGALTVTPAVGYEIHELKISTGVVREYLAPGGLVFAVSWQGRRAPDLRQLLGAYFERYAAEARAHRTGHHVLSVDTGSTGFRVLGEVLGAGVTSGQLQQVTDGSGNPVVECVQFADGYSWGPIKLVDLTIGGMKAASVPIQVIGDPAYASSTIPSACSSFVNVPENRLAQFGANAILGVGNFLEDCGSSCASGAQDGSAYNVCPPAMAPACQPATMDLTAQVQIGRAS